MDNSRAQVKETIVSPDVVGGDRSVITAPVTTGSERVLLVPMAEWKQSAQRGVRSFIQCATFLLGGGSLAIFLASFGIAPDYVAQIPTSGNKLVDALLVSLVFGLVCFVWNWVEFWLDIDIKAPKFRA
jgi:hypothetical protein